MKLAVTSQDGKGDFLFSQVGPWGEFKNKLESLGSEIVSLSDNPDAIIFNNYSSKLFKKHALRLPSRRRILIAWEPPANLPLMYTEQTLSRFGKRFYPSPIWARRYGGMSFYWPQGKDQNRAELNNRIDSKICVIQSNRWSLSSHEMYSLRREVITRLEQRIDLYGRGWNQGVTRDAIQLMKILPNQSPGDLRRIFRYLPQLGRRHESYLGHVEDKHLIISRYLFTLVIENSPEYVSEKLFDALLAGTIPIYIGAELDVFGIPSDIAIVAKPSAEDVYRQFLTARSDTKLIHEKLWKAKEFLNSDLFKEMHGNRLLNSLAERVFEAINH